MGNTFNGHEFPVREMLITKGVHNTFHEQEQKLTQGKSEKPDRTEIHYSFIV